MNICTSIYIYITPILQNTGRGEAGFDTGGPAVFFGKLPPPTVFPTDPTLPPTVCFL